MGAKNLVIAGDYKGKRVSGSVGSASISISLLKFIYLNKDTIEDYEVITDEHRKSATSGVARGVVGSALLGPVGLVAGAVSAKRKGIYTVAVKFRDGKNSLLEINDKIYKLMVKNCF